jgi:hypothetical protein
MLEPYGNLEGTKMDPCWFLVGSQRKGPEGPPRFQASLRHAWVPSQNPVDFLPSIL